MTRSGLVAGLVLVAAATVGCGPGPLPPEEPAPAVISVEPGLRPTLTAEQVAGIVIDHIRSDERAAGRVVAPARIVRMSVTTWSGAARIEPNAGRPDPPSNEAVWVVRAFGTFTTQRGRNGAQPAAAGSGYYVIADADGSVLGFGFP